MRESKLNYVLWLIAAAAISCAAVWFLRNVYPGPETPKPVGWVGDAK